MKYRAEFDTAEDRQRFVEYCGTDVELVFPSVEDTYSEDTYSVTFNFVWWMEPQLLEIIQKRFHGRLMTVPL